MKIVPLKDEDNSNFLFQLKGQFLFTVSMLIILCLSFLIVYSFFSSFIFESGFQLKNLSIELLSLLVISYGVRLIKLGNIDVALHFILITSFIGIWSTIFLGDVTSYERYNTIVFTFGVLSLTSLISKETKKYIFLYTIINIVCLVLLSIFLYNHKVIPFSLLIDFFLDFLFAFILVAIITYNVFVIYQKAFNKIDKHLAEAELAKSEVIILNEELEEKVEQRNLELKLSLDKIEDSNIELTTLNELMIVESSELRNTNYKLQISEERLNISNQTKDKFFSIIAHDLRNPFLVLINNSELLENYFHKMNDEEKLKIINQIKNASNSTYSLLQDLLQWSRSQMNNIEFEPKEYNLYEIVFKIENILKLQAFGKEITLANNIPNDTLIYCDYDMVSTIIRNLISNSIKFTERGGFIEIDLSKDIKSNSANTNFYIKDNGIGMSEEIVKKLFKIGEKVSKSGTEKEPSSGLGLILCKDFVDKHNGLIWIESEVGNGTTFHLSFPNLK